MQKPGQKSASMPCSEAQSKDLRSAIQRCNVEDGSLNRNTPLTVHKDSWRVFRTASLRALIVTLFALLVPLVALATDAKQLVKRYTIGVEDINYYPYYDFVDRQQNHGLLKDILDDFARKQGIEFEYVALPIKRFDFWYNENKIDFRVPDNPRWHGKKQHNLLFSEPVVILPTGTVVKQQYQHLPLHEFTSIGTFTGFTPSPHWLEAAQDRQLEFMHDPSLRVLIRLLFEEQVQGLDLDLYTIRFHAGLMGLDPSRLVYADHVPDRVIQYYLSTVKHPDILKKFNKYLRANRKQIQRKLKQAQK